MTHSHESTQLSLSGELHEMGQRVQLPYSLTRALAWDVAATLMECHDDLVVLELHPGGGQYDCLSIYERPSRLIAHMNLTGSLTHGSWFAHDGDRISWLEVLTNGSRWAATLIEDVEDVLPPAKPTSPEARTARACAVLARTVALQEDVSILSAVVDSSYGASRRQDLVDPFLEVCGAELQLPENSAASPIGSGAYRWWFVTRETELGNAPVACLDAATARIWVQDDPTPHLLSALPPAELVSLVFGHL